MFLVYIVVAVLVMALLLAIPLFPFWKVWARMKAQHPDIWKSAGPFEPADMIRSVGLIDIFIQVIIRMSNDKDLQARDREIVRWAHMSVEVMRLVPRTLSSRILYVVIFAGVTYRLVTLIVH